MDAQTVMQLVGLTVLATVNVSLWTFRVALAAGGRRAAAALVAGIEAMLFVVAFGSVMSALDEPSRVVAYGLGVAAGTLVGILADERLAGGQSLVTTIVDGNGEEARARLHQGGWPVTATEAVGVRGPVTVLTVAVNDGVLPRLTADLDREAPEGFVTIERLRTVRPTAFSANMHAAGRRAPSALPLPRRRRP